MPEFSQFGPFELEPQKSFTEHGGRIEFEGRDMGVGTDEAVDGTGGKGEGVEDGLGFAKIIDISAELGNLAGEDAHNANLIFKGANGSFFETIELRLGETTGVKAMCKRILIA